MHRLARHTDKNQRTLRLSILDRPGKFAAAATAIAHADAFLGDIMTVDEDTDHLIRDVSIYYDDYEHLQMILQALNEIDGIKVVDVIDTVFELHKGGKLEVVPRYTIRSLDDLAKVYTPGVASVCRAIEKDPDLAYELTMKGSTIAVVTTGTAVLGLGDITALAGLPVMEGKAMLLKQLGNVGGFPILIETHDPHVVIETVQRIAGVFGAIQLEDIAAPDCFLIEEQLDRTLDIPVMHDDQHGTAVVALAGLVKGLAHVGKRKADLSVVILGAGAAGLAIADMLLHWGVGRLVVVDSHGILSPARTDLNQWKRGIAERSNPDGRTGPLADAMQGADVFIGVSRAGLVSKDMVRSMAPGAVVFPMANPIPEIWPSEALEAGAAFAIDGRSLNNALAFPGIFRGALDVRATHINMAMKVAAAEAIAELAKPLRLMPSILEPEVHRTVAAAVIDAAIQSGVARVGLPSAPPLT